MTEMPTATAQARHIDTRDVAKLLRPVLRKAFPGIKFSVRIDRYSMGSSVDIAWTDGPTERRVRELVGAFCGSRFEGMSDCTYSADSWYCAEHWARTAEEYGGDAWCDLGIRSSRCCAKAELVHFGNTSLGTSRNRSAEFDGWLADRISRRLNLPYEPGVYVAAEDEFMSTLLYRESLEFEGIPT